MIELFAFNSLPGILLEGIPLYVVVRLFIIAGIMYALGMLWYGFLFRDRWMALAEKPDCEKTNVPAMVVQFIGTLVLVWFVLMLLLVSGDLNTFVFLVFALFVLQALGMLIDRMFHGTDNRTAVKLWAIHAGYHLVIISLSAAAAYFFM